jgi:IS30 family transposase
VGTLVERTTRYVLLHLPHGRDAHLVEQAMRQAITGLPAGLARIAASLHGRPRKTLGYLTPSEKLAELLAHTD